jgi:hypothetical protein
MCPLGRMLLYLPVLMAAILPGCTLKLTTDLSKLIGMDNPRELMGSSEAQQIATRIGEGMGTKIMEGEILAEDMGKGLGEVFLKPEQVAVIKDPVTIELVEKSGMAAVQAGRFDDAVDAFKRTRNLARLEEIALILFDQGNAADAADLHQYLTDHDWPIRAPYLVARRIEQKQLFPLNNARLKEIDPQQYNLHYARKSHTILDIVSLDETYVRNNTLTKADMIMRLKTAPVIILADSYFDTNQHSIFLEIVTALPHKDLVIGLEEGLSRLTGRQATADKLNYLPLLTFIEEQGIATFVHGPSATQKQDDARGSIDFFGWDSAVATTVSDLVGKNKQVLLLVGSTHASTDHLPFLIEVASGFDPVVVVQSPLGLQVGQLFDKHESMRGRLDAWGAGDESAITIENDFYLNTRLSADDFKTYLELFALQPLSASP